MDQLLIGIPILNWIAAGTAFLTIVVLVPIVRGSIKRRCPSDSGTDDARSWRGLVGALNHRWMRATTLMVAASIAALAIGTDGRVADAAKISLIAALTLQSLRLIPVLVDWILLRISAPDPADPARTSAVNLTGLRWLILLGAYSLVLLLSLQNMGVNVTSLIAGLGIGGIAVALALQNVLGDLFASLTISLDKPFVVGDFIVVGSEMGVVEHIGLKTTRVRSLSGEQLVFGNADLLTSRIRNYKRMNERRVVFGFGVVYATPFQTLTEINSIVRVAIESQSNVRFDRCHFYRFGGSSLDFEAVYFISTPDYNAHMDAQQAIHLAIARAFRERDINFAFPSQTVYLADRSAETSRGVTG